ncbi:RsiW-degrading membrane proteinase PrsW (M82 family) [Bacillus mesophilus]|uniref:Protease PrsW n=1 Tax=Bacillus mesophilus TaxID=1808955 RepID=A0A6M0Q4T9_9BACI|nr:glutamic-type intramembrane protease PrsW [Bacillus mesophilus]MBM7661221.1 RsiW-degrading membrane proteinase PrsW (M82 family) [Bacillus mesophilus]NEY71254.1 intramembrane metalloprotease PrsW [Bacillus mesophilus]
MLGIITAGIAPGVALLSYFYLKDQYDSEPVSMVVRTFIFGAILVFPIMFIQYVLTEEQVIHSPLMQSFLAAGLLEEFFKWFILFFIAYKHVEFDEIYDGIVYGASVSLGFATAENIIYLFAHGVDIAMGRALLPVSSHALFGVIMGYYLGKSKFTFGSVKKRFLLWSLMIPFILHGLYNFIIYSIEEWVVFIIPFMIFLWWLGLRKVKLARVLQHTSVKQLSQ